MLGERELASADLSQFDTIMTGTRAYAVREDLKTYNSRLLDYVKAGGNMIVLYNTQELVPNTFAPFPGELPRTAEEVSEEDSPVTILAPGAPGVQLAEQDHGGRFRRLGRAARLEVLHEVGCGVYADDLDVRQESAAAEWRLADGESRQRQRGPTSPMHYIVSCLTVSRAPTELQPTFLL